MSELERLVNGNEIFQARTQGMGYLDPQQALAYGLTGPMAWASGTCPQVLSALARQLLCAFQAGFRLLTCVFPHSYLFTFSFLLLPCLRLRAREARRVMATMSNAMTIIITPTQASWVTASQRRARPPTAAPPAIPR